jgi:hypothetical protein
MLDCWLIFLMFAKISLKIQTWKTSVYELKSLKDGLTFCKVRTFGSIPFLTFDFFSRLQELVEVRR